MDVVREVGRQIKVLRTSRFGPRLTQEDLAEQAEISVSFLSMIERGERAPHLETLAKIADALHVPIAELFAFDRNPDVVESLYQPLIDYCRKRTLTKKDMDRLLVVAKAMFP